MRRIFVPAFAIAAAFALSACGTTASVDRGTDNGATYKGSPYSFNYPNPNDR